MIFKEGNKRYEVSKITRKRIGLTTKQRWENPKYRKRLILAHKGHKGYWLGKHRSKETIKKIRKANKGKHYSRTTEFKKGYKVSKEKIKKKEESWNWKGDKAGIGAFHTYMRKYKPKPKWNLCEFCHKRKDDNGRTKLDVANIKNHKYSRNPDDYKWFHKSCHKKYDFPNGWGNSIKKKKQKHL